MAASGHCRANCSTTASDPANSVNRSCTIATSGVLPLVPAGPSGSTTDSIGTRTCVYCPEPPQKVRPVGSEWRFLHLPAFHLDRLVPAPLGPPANLRWPGDPRLPQWPPVHVRSV